MHMLIPFVAALFAAANDSTVYPVLNHDRPAGSMVVVRHGDSVTVRYIFTDRNRGTLIETRYLMRGDSVVWMESRPVLPNDQAGDPTIRVEFAGDSVRRIASARTGPTNLGHDRAGTRAYTVGSFMVDPSFNDCDRPDAARARREERLQMNPNKALWEKGDFTRIAATMRDSGEALVGGLSITPGLKVCVPFESIPQFVQTFFTHNENS